MKRLKGSIHISHPKCSDDREIVCISVEDDLSGCEVVDLEMDLGEFALALMGRYCRPCEYELRPKYAGMKREVKEVVVKRPRDRSEFTESLARNLAKEYLVDGWDIHRLDDFTNHHRWVKDDGVKVVLIRFVAVTEDAT